MTQSVELKINDRVVRGTLKTRGNYLLFEPQAGADNGERMYIPNGKMEYKASVSSVNSPTPMISTFLDLERRFSLSEDYLASYS